MINIFFRPLPFFLSLLPYPISNSINNNDIRNSNNLIPILRSLILCNALVLSPLTKSFDTLGNDDDVDDSFDDDSFDDDSFDDDAFDDDAFDDDGFDDDVFDDDAFDDPDDDDPDDPDDDDNDLINKLLILVFLHNNDIDDIDDNNFLFAMILFEIIQSINTND